MGDIQLQIDLTNIILAIVAIVALIAAWRQLKTMQADSQTQIEIAKNQELATRASVLLHLDERFGTQAMVDARNEMAALMVRVNKKADEEKGFLAPEARRKESDYYPEELERMRNASATEPYGRLMVALSFFETVGYVTSSQYIPLDDVLKLFGPTIDEAGIAFEAHIKKLRSDVYKNKPLYNNFLWLIEESKKASTGKK
jgi:hypothetical protein